MSELVNSKDNRNDEEDRATNSSSSKGNNLAPKASQQSVQTVKSNSKERTVPCVFFANGNCRYGNSCKFLHEIYNSVPPIVPIVAQQMMQPVPMMGMPMNFPMVPPIVNIPPGHPVFSVDVECVATAVHHNARSVAQIALVNEFNNVVFNAHIKQEQPVLSYITELTGLTEESLKDGTPLVEAMASLRQMLPQNAILVGQNILKDINWLQLVQGVDFHSLIDLSGLFRVWNPTRGEYTSFSQDHVAKVWLGLPVRPNHTAIDDAGVSMALFKAYLHVQYDHAKLYHLQYMTLMAERTPGFSSRYPVLDGCCMGNRKKCSCGAPFFS